MKKISVINKRISVIEIIVFIVFIILTFNLLKIILFNGKMYKQILTNLTNVYVYGDSAPRGRIYDRNYNLLVDNEGVNVIYYKKNSNVTALEEIELAYSVIDHIDLDYNRLRNRNLREFYLVLYQEECSRKITKEEC